jgi:hypothetical protein
MRFTSGRNPKEERVIAAWFLFMKQNCEYEEYIETIFKDFGDQLLSIGFNCRFPEI